MPSKLTIFVVGLVLFAILAAPSTAQNPGNRCGNGVCQASVGENPNTCPADCGAPPTPTPNPTSTPPPNPTSTPSASPPGETSPPSGPSGGDSGSQSSSETSLAPSITFTNIPSSPTNNNDPFFQGEAGSGAEEVQYRVNNGNWTTASGVNNFSFSLSNLSDGTYTIEVRARYAGDKYTSTISAVLVVVTTPPQITTNIPEEPTDDAEFQVSGVISSPITITLVQISLDGGETWLSTSYTNRTFSSTLPPFEDGNYEILVRAFDSAGNIGFSDLKTLIIDTLPPILGTQIISSGPIIVSPKSTGVYNLVAQTPFSVTLSMKGGPTEVTIKLDSKEFSLSRIGTTNIWTGEINLSESGLFDLNLQAVDGAQNKLDRFMGKVNVNKEGFLRTEGKNVEGGTVSLYVFDDETKNWILWDAETFGQENPKTKRSSFSYYLPAGTYYLEIDALHFRKAQSKIFTLKEAQVVSSDVFLESIPSFELSLPFLGTTTLTLPQYYLPSVFEITTTNVTTQIEIKQEETDFINNLGFSNGLLVILDTWSPTALQQAFVLDKIDKSLEIKTFFVHSSQSKTNAFMSRGGYDFETDVDETGEEVSLITVNSPTHFFVSNGKVVEKFEGFLSAEEIVAELEKLR